jgi:AraC family transcriptional regulator of adaptative response/methylated-DNA-[protein]-cysteine methyltransferase
VVKACRLMEKADETPDLDTLANTLGMSRFHFHRVFKAVTGLTPKAYSDALRARRVKEELSRRDSVTGAIYGAGFNSSGRFYSAATDMLGMTPTEFRSGGRGASIRFAVGQCSLGAILVAATGKGVCAITLGDEPGALIREFQDRFHNAELIGGDEGFERLVARVVGLVEAPGLGLDLPLDVMGTAFQTRVWQALRQIPPGSTVSYKEIAEVIGSPKAARAVARACASNKIAVAIPCHRITRSDGSLRLPMGYRAQAEAPQEGGRVNNCKAAASDNGISALPAGEQSYENDYMRKYDYRDHESQKEVEREPQKLAHRARLRECEPRRRKDDEQDIGKAERVPKQIEGPACLSRRPDE